MRKVLVVAYFFPPLGGSGIQRTLKFVKYLPQYGWLPVVLTQKHGHHYASDYEQLDLVPRQVKVIRANTFEFIKLRRTISKLLRKLIARASKNNQNNDQHNISTSKRIYPLSLMRRFIEQWIFIPDSKVRWLPAALQTGSKIAKNRGIHILYSTSYPYTCHLIGYLLKMITSKLWVADFRDPWADNVFMTEGFSSLRKKLDNWLEGKVVQKADVVILPTKPIGEQFKNKYPWKDSEKFKVIPNGYDEEDFRGMNVEKPSKFTIVFTGTLTPPSTPGKFFEALAQVSFERSDIISNFKVLFVGWIDPIYRKRISELKLDHLIEIIPYVPRKRCLQIMAGASILLLPLSKSWKSKGVFTGKIFDYLGARKPILGLLPEDIAANLIRQTNSGIAVDPEDREAITNAILAFYEKYKNNALLLDSGTLPGEYSRQYLTKTLAQVFDELTIPRK